MEQLILDQIKNEIHSLRKLYLISTSTSPISDQWIPLYEVKKYFNYGSTQMASLEKSGQLIISKIGKRKFIRKDSIAKLLDNNIIPHNAA